MDAESILEKLKEDIYNKFGYRGEMWGDNSPVDDEYEPQGSLEDVWEFIEDKLKDILSDIL